MIYTQDVQGCLSGLIGKFGLVNFDGYLAQAKQAMLEIKQEQQQGALPVLDIPEVSQDIEIIKNKAEFFRKNFSDIIVLGTGGSSLGGQTLVACADSSGPRIHFLDNIDPHTFDRVFKEFDPKKTGVIAISKSGTTAETLCQFMSCLQHWPAENFLVITDPKDSPIKEVAAQHNIAIFDHDAGIGGRFAALTIVGLLPTMIAGLDPYKVRKGAQWTLENPDAAVMGSAVSMALLRDKEITNTVMMPYSDRLASFGLWFRQLWAESLGKQGQGTTPIRALGTVDQHSQLQLYLDGPRDKMFTIITTDCAGLGERIQDQWTKYDGLEYLTGRTMGDLLDSEQRATISALISKGCPTRVINLSKVDEEALGALMMHFILETMIVAKMMGVNAFDQPAVEEGKRLTREYLKKVANA